MLNSFKFKVPAEIYIKEIPKKPIIVATELCTKYLYALSIPKFESLFNPIKQYIHKLTNSKNG